MTRTIAWSFVADDDLGRLDRAVASRIENAVDRLALSDEGDVTRVRRGDDLFRLRVGQWRVLFTYEDGKLVVLRVLPRDKVYRDR